MTYKLKRFYLRNLYSSFYYKLDYKKSYYEHVETIFWAITAKYFTNYSSTQKILSTVTCTELEQTDTKPLMKKLTILTKKVKDFTAILFSKVNKQTKQDTTITTMTPTATLEKEEATTKPEATSGVTQNLVNDVHNGTATKPTTEAGTPAIDEDNLEIERIEKTCYMDLSGLDQIHSPDDAEGFKYYVPECVPGAPLEVYDLYAFHFLDTGETRYYSTTHIKEDFVFYIYPTKNAQDVDIWALFIQLVEVQI